MAAMERICPLSAPPPADWARIRWPQQMRQPTPADGMRLCPVRVSTPDDMRIIWDYEGPHAISWLAYRGDTVKLRSR